MRSEFSAYMPKGFAPAARICLVNVRHIRVFRVNLPAQLAGKRHPDQGMPLRPREPWHVGASASQWTDPHRSGRQVLCARSVQQRSAYRARWWFHAPFTPSGTDLRTNPPSCHCAAAAVISTKLFSSSRIQDISVSIRPRFVRHIDQVSSSRPWECHLYRTRAASHPPPRPAPKSARNPAGPAHRRRPAPPRISSLIRCSHGPARPHVLRRFKRGIIAFPGKPVGPFPAVYRPPSRRPVL